MHFIVSAAMNTDTDGCTEMVLSVSLDSSQTPILPAVITPHTVNGVDGALPPIMTEGHNIQKPAGR